MNENLNYFMSFEESQEYISKCGFDIPWNDGDVFVDYRDITRTVGNVLKWQEDNLKKQGAIKEDLPIDTPVMVSINTHKWSLRYYAGNNTVWYCGAHDDEKIAEGEKYPWPFIIPFDKFNPRDIVGSLKYNIVK